MNKYQSHKIVEAGIVTEFAMRPRDYSITVEGDRALVGVSREVGDRISKMANEAGTTVVGGALVQYPDGYMSWSPRGPFEDRHRKIGEATFSDALEGLRRGEKWQRDGWNGKGQWLALQSPDENSKMTLPYLYIYTTSYDLVPWLASQGDMLAEDWAQI